MAWRHSLALAAALAGCKSKSKLDPAPVARSGFTIDGELDEPAWNATAQRGVFVGDDGKPARPYSELRWLRDAGHLYVGLYAADEDIRSSDAFELAIGTFGLHITADGKVQRRLGLPEELVPAPPEVHVGVDRDGTLDVPTDDDEEWVVEVELPTALVGDEHLHARRCDHPKVGTERCGAY